VPKLKTHTFMLMTCAIKNTFGLVPGMNKSRMHAIAINPESFAQILVDIFKEVNPLINIVDGIIGMEGEGPSAGNPRKFGKLIIGDDAVAVDVISSIILGYSPQEIYTNLVAYKKGLGEIDIEKIEVIGEEKDKLYNHDVAKVKNFYSLTKNLPSFMGNIASFLFNKLIRQYPVIDDAKCIKCRICENGCPKKAISLINNKMVIDYSKCISCFCCHELCPQKAIRLEKSLLAKNIFR
jgi:Pyruvate/2-oxoacid:ferredoxin oxidoreductase delta subunit